MGVVEQASFELPVATIPAFADRAPLVRRARFLALLLGRGLRRLAVEASGRTVSSSGAAIVVLWRFSARRDASEAAELRAQRLIGASFFAIAIYVGVEAVRTLVAGDHPESSWVGIGLALVTLATMPPLAAAKARVGEKLNSAATRSEGRQNLLCAYLSAALLVGLIANAAPAGGGRTRPRPL